MRKLLLLWKHLLKVKEMKVYRKLNKEEIEILERQMCSASDWNLVEVTDGFSTDYVRYARFSGNVRL